MSARIYPKPSGHAFRYVQNISPAAGLLLLLGSACSDQKIASAPPAQSSIQITQGPAPSGQASASASSQSPLNGTSSAGKAALQNQTFSPFALAIRAGRWKEAADLIDALPEPEKNKAEVRYARARAAISIEDYSKAVVLLSNLGRELPDLAGDIARFYADAAFFAGPFTDAAKYFAQGSKAKDYLKAAQAYQKAGDLANARALADKCIDTAQRTKNKNVEMEGHAFRAQLILGARGDKGEKTANPKIDPVAAGDLRHLALFAGASPEGKNAAETLELYKIGLNAQERMKAAEEMIETGAEGAEQALAEIDKLLVLPKAKRKELLHLRAAALYKMRSYADAAKAFTLAAKSKSGREAEQGMMAAKALARAGQHKEALARYGEVFARYRSTPYGEQSAYQVARLLLMSGQFKESIAAYTKYLATYPKGKDRDDAAFDLALAHLSGGQFDKARKQFAQFAQQAKPDAAAKFKELEGVAALRAKDKEGAIEIWTNIMREAPLTWASLAARARLASVGAPLPPLMPEIKANGAAAQPAALRIELPKTAALLFSLGLDADAEHLISSNESEAAQAYAGRESEALCGMYGMLSHAKRRYRVGAAAISYASLMRAPEPSERWAWECIYPKPYAETAQALEEQHGLPKGILHALMRQESAFDPAARSAANAVGLLQLIPKTASRVSAELSMPYEPERLVKPEMSLKLGAHYFAKLVKMFQGSLPLAIAAYNAGPLAISNWLETSVDNDVDLWVSRIPYEETRNYVGRVMQNLARYQWLEGGDSAVFSLPLDIPSGARAPADAY